MSDKGATKALRLKLPEEPVDGFEVTYFTIRGEYLQEIRLKYHSNSKWSDVSSDKGGADLVDQWQLFTDGYFSGRMEGWATPTTINHADHYEAREDAVTALKDCLERCAQQADERRVGEKDRRKIIIYGRTAMEKRFGLSDRRVSPPVAIVRELHHKRWNHFTLAELQLLQLGQWVLAEESRVDFALVGDSLRLRTQLSRALERKVAESVSLSSEAEGTETK